MAQRRESGRTRRPAPHPLKEIRQTSGESDDGIAPLNSYTPASTPSAPSAPRQPITQ